MDEAAVTAYFWAWGAYVLGALGLLIVGWRITRGMQSEWRQLLLVSAAAILLTPAALPDMEQTVLAPALFILVLQGLFENGSFALSAALLLLGVWVIGLLISLAFQLLRRSKSAPKSQPQTKKSKAE